jgi:glucose-6-phosphate isomerase, archaeal
MEHLKIIRTSVEFNLDDYRLKGDPVISQHRKLNDLTGIFRDEKVFSAMDLEQTAYTVQAWLPVKEGTPGGLFFGRTSLMPGKVGDEYFMTKGHFHMQSDRAEFYWGVQGNGMLILMDRDRRTWAEELFPGSLHYIPAHVAHRVANTGNSTLVFGACWPSDAGHDYEEIARNGFSARLVERNGKPELVEC